MAASAIASREGPSPYQARLMLAVFAALALAGAALGFRGGQVPERQPSAAAQTAPDLALYREIVAAVRAGEGYYPAARERLPQFGFPTKSPLNWRLPTYAWFFAALPATWMVQALLALLAAAAIYATFLAQRMKSGAGYALGSAVLLLGVAGWVFDGQAYLAQEVWAAILLALSLAAHSVATASAASGRRTWWTVLAIASALAALFIRELALPYCGMAMLLASWNRRWMEAIAWALGIAAFFAFFAWHVGQVDRALAETAAPGGGLDLVQWLRFGGLDFVLLTTRLNRLLFSAPGCILWLYIVASLVGLARRGDETSTLACLASLAYLLVFAVAGRPENFYWGLLPAPLLAFGAATSPQALASLWRMAHFHAAPATSQATVVPGTAQQTSAGRS